MGDEQKPIPTLETIYSATRVEELKKRRQDPEQQNTRPPAAPVPALGVVKPLVRLADLHHEGKDAS